jgi:hypothetical protein
VDGITAMDVRLRELLATGRPTVDDILQAVGTLQPASVRTPQSMASTPHYQLPLARDRDRARTPQGAASSFSGGTCSCVCFCLLRREALMLRAPGSAPFSPVSSRGRDRERPASASALAQGRSLSATDAAPQSLPPVPQPQPQPQRPVAASVPDAPHAAAPQPLFEQVSDAVAALRQLQAERGQMEAALAALRRDVEAKALENDALVAQVIEDDHRVKSIDADRSAAADRCRQLEDAARAAQHAADSARDEAAQWRAQAEHWHAAAEVRGCVARGQPVLTTAWAIDGRSPSRCGGERAAAVARGSAWYGYV